MSNSADGSSSIRINRYLAQCGLGSRRACEKLVTNGRIIINGQQVTSLSTTVDPDVDVVEHRGKVLEPVRKLEFLAYHKPPGVLVTKSDPEGRATIYDALRESGGRNVDHLKYVGRLDLHSEGLLLLSNDGDLIHALTHPRFHVKKVYNVMVDRPLSDSGLEVMTGRGVVSAGDVLHAGSIKPLKHPEAGGRGVWYQVELFEGKNRQIRRMFEAFNCAIERLVRIQFGSSKLGDLAPGAIRALTEREVGGLRNAGYR